MEESISFTVVLGFLDRSRNYVQRCWCPFLAARLPPSVPIVHKFFRPLRVDYTLNIRKQEKLRKVEKTV